MFEIWFGEFRRWDTIVNAFIQGSITRGLARKCFNVKEKIFFFVLLEYSTFCFFSLYLLFYSSFPRKKFFQIIRISQSLKIHHSFGIQYCSRCKNKLTFYSIAQMLGLYSMPNKTRNAMCQYMIEYLSANRFSIFMFYK